MKFPFHNKMRQDIKKVALRFCSLLLLILSGTELSVAQLNPLGGMYFQNQYLANPAMAGLDSGLNLNLGYRQQWSSIPGAPKTQSLTGDYGFGNKVGLGLNIYSDEAGLLRKTRVMGTYAYHLPIGADEQKLNFGISLGFMNERIGYEDLKGDAGDQNVGRFNQRETYIDGDFGVSFTSNRLTLQGALPNLKTFFKTDANTNNVDRSTFFTAASYKFYFAQSLDGLRVEPKACFRGIKGLDNIGDIGAEVSFADESVNLMGMYHTSQSATFGMGVNFQKTLSILGIYTTETSALSGYTNGNFEIAVKVGLF